MYAFQGCTGLTSLTLNKVKNVKAYAFQGCTGLTSLTLNEVESIGEYAFQGCTGPTSLTLNEVESIGECAFQGCTGITSLTLNKAGEYAFEKLPNIVSISLECEVIPDNTFAECAKLESVSLTKVRYIGKNAFKECTDLKSVNITTEESTAIEDSAFYKCIELQKISIEGQYIDRIGNAAFAECNHLDKFLCPNVKTIGDYAFANCYSLYGINERKENCFTPSLVEEIGANAFAGCSALEATFGLYSLKRIGENAFLDCSNLDDLSFGPYLEEIPDKGLGCTALRYLQMPCNLKKIGMNAFSDCSKLTYLYILNGTCKNLNVHTFDGTNLKNVEILNSDIDYTDVFANSDKIGVQSICYFIMRTSTIPKLTNYIFSNTNHVILYVPLGMYSDYKSSYWGNASKILEYTTTEIKETEFKSSIIKPVIYSIDGKQTNMNEKGLKILRYPNGTSKKVIVK